MMSDAPRHERNKAVMKFLKALAHSTLMRVLGVLFLMVLGAWVGAIALGVWNPAGLFTSDGDDGGGRGLILADFDQKGPSAKDQFEYAEMGAVIFTQEVSNPDFSYKGNSLQVTVDTSETGSFAGWGIALNGLNLRSPVTFISLCIKARGLEGGETFALGLKSNDGVERTNVISGLTPDWAIVDLGLTNFSPVDLGSLENVSINFGTGVRGTLFVDDIIFMREGACAGSVGEVIVPGQEQPPQ